MTRAAKQARWWKGRRRLRTTRAGAALIAVTFASGFAAFNTGNNLLFFGWGLLLSSIVVSGILSEATLRAVSLTTLAQGEARAREPAALALLVRNTRLVPAFAVELRALFADKAIAPARSFELRVAPKSEHKTALAFTPARRGTLVVDTVQALTAFPFGFFEKEKRVTFDPPIELVVLPGRVDVRTALADLLARLGDSPARRPGPGDELFSLRPFRAGDDPRRIAWRRSAKTGRVVIKETEAARSNDVILDLVLAGARPDDVDHAVDVCGSLAEDLLARGHAVGVRAPGLAITPAAGPRQRAALLMALAIVDAASPVPPLPVRRAVVVAVVARGAAAPQLAVVIDAARIAA